MARFLLQGHRAFVGVGEAGAGAVSADRGDVVGAAGIRIDAVELTLELAARPEYGLIRPLIRLEDGKSITLQTIGVRFRRTMELILSVTVPKVCPGSITAGVVWMRVSSCGLSILDLDM